MARARACCERLLGTGSGTRPVIEIRGERNPLFPGMKGPEPLAETLGPLMQAVKAHGADLGIAFDGDGDRIALVDSHGEFVSSQDTFAMLAMYLGERDDVRTGAIVRSVNGSVMLDLLAERYDVPLIETPIGYAHIAPAMIEHEAMLGGEESGGFAFGTHLPERDAFVAALYILDLLQRRGTDIAGLRYGVEIRTGAWHYRRLDVPLAADEMDDGARPPCRGRDWRYRPRGVARDEDRHARRHQTDRRGSPLAARAHERDGTAGAHLRRGARPGDGCIPPRPRSIAPAARERGARFPRTAACRRGRANSEPAATATPARGGRSRTYTRRREG